MLYTKYRFEAAAHTHARCDGLGTTCTFTRRATLLFIITLFIQMLQQNAYVVHIHATNSSINSTLGPTVTCISLHPVHTTDSTQPLYGSMRVAERQQHNKSATKKTCCVVGCGRCGFMQHIHSSSSKERYTLGRKQAIMRGAQKERRLKRGAHSYVLVLSILF